eukprot:gene20892-21623_t
MALIRTALGLCATFGIFTFAATGSSFADSWKFNIVNSSDFKVLSFQTNENGGWSKNWLGENIAPGETFVMDFGTSEGNCTVRTHITFNDGTHVDGDVDYCKVATLTIHNDGVSAE